MAREAADSSPDGFLGWIDMMTTLVLLCLLALFLALQILGATRESARADEETLGSLASQVALLQRELTQAHQGLAGERTRLAQYSQELATQLTVSRQEKTALEQVLAELRRERSRRFILTNEQEDIVFFDTGKATIKEEFKPILARYVTLARAYLQEDLRHLIQVEGHTDDVPCCRASPYADNWELSSARATAVVKFFAERGVDPHRLVAVGHGEYKPLLPEKTEGARAHNRRIEMVFIARSSLPAQIAASP